ncbi:MAG: response regulator [Bacteroidales bacterium]|nr:response regulator [Bacteroidales bacterium]
MRNRLCTLICLLMPLLAASGESRLPESYLSENDGLSSNSVHCCIQDSRGFLWVGTSGGLDLFDGQLVHSFGHATYSLLEADGKIWSGTENGLWTYSIDSGEFIPFEAVTRYGVNIVSRVNALEIFDGTVIWAGTDGQGVFLYNITSGILVQHSTRTPYVDKILPSPDGRVIVVDKEGFGHLYSAKGDYIMPTGEKVRIQKDTLRDREGNCWIPTEDRGLLKITREDTEMETFSVPATGAATSSKNRISLAEDDDGCIFIGIHNKLYTLEYGRGEVRPCGSFSTHGEITRLLYTPEGLWIGTDSDGIFLYNPVKRTVKHYQTGVNTQVLYRSSKGELLVGTNLGIFSFSPDNDEFYPSLNRKNIRIVIDGKPPVDASLKEFELVSQSSVVAMCEDGGHYLYMATSNRGLFRMDMITRGWEHLVTSAGSKDNLPWKKITTLFRSDDGIIWCGTAGDGLWYLQQGGLTFRHYSSVDRRLYESEIDDIAEDRDGNLWLCAASGLLKLNTTTSSVTPFNIKAASIIYASSGKLWTGRQDALVAFLPEQIAPQRISPNTVIREMTVGDSTMFIPPGGRSVRLSYQNNRFSLRLASLSYSNPSQNLYTWQLKGFDRDWSLPSTSPIVTYTKVPPGDYIFQAQDCDDKIHITIRPPWWRSMGAIIFYILAAAAVLFLLLNFWKGRINRRYATLMKEQEEEREKALYKQRIRFFMGLVHEIRTPLTLIRLQHEKDAPGASDAITRNLDYMQETINRILTYDKQTSGNIEMILTRLDLREVVASISGTFADSAASEGIQLITSLGEEEVPVNADEDMITKILTNLLSNALKYTKDRIAISVSRDGADAVISVTDNGPGVKEDQREKIFEMFYTPPDDPVAETSGIGVGLAYARQLAKAHGGSIIVENAVPQGASFVFRMPALDESLTEPKTSMEKMRSSSGRRLTILVVEDNHELRETLRSDLSAWYDILTAANGEEALSWIEKDSVDLVVSDVMMPVMDGFQLCRHIKSQISYSHIPVILLTAKVSLDAKSEGMESGANAYVEKPFSIRQLHGQIENLITLREIFRESVARGELAQPDVQGPEADFIRSINDAIERQISEENFSIEALASEMAMSRTNFFRKFKALTGITPNDHLKNYRLDKAADLIRKGARINEAAESVGFTSSSYFAKCFKARFGLLPKDYLK